MHAVKLNLGIAVLAFGLGYFAAQFKPNQPLDSPKTPESAIQNPLEKPSPDYRSDTTAILKNIAQAEQTGKLINQSNIIDIQKIVAKTPEQTINTYLKKAFPNADL